MRKYQKRACSRGENDCKLEQRVGKRNLLEIADIRAFQLKAGEIDESS